MRFTRVLLALDAGAPDNDVLPLSISAEAIRLNWNRASKRIIADAQTRVALERADVLPYAG